MSARTRLLSIGSVASAVVAGSLLHPVVTGQTANTTNQGGAIGIGLVPAAAGFVLLALLLGLVAYTPRTVARLARRVGSTSRSLTPRPSSFMAVVTAGLLVSAAATGGLLGPQAQDFSQQSEPVQQAGAIAPLLVVAGGYAVGIAVSFAAGYVAGDYLSGDDPENVTVDADAWQTWINTAVHGHTISEDDATLDAVMSNQVNDDSRSVAYAKAKATAIKEMNNGTSEQGVKDAMNDSIDDYYSSMETNYLRSKSRSTDRLLYLDGVYDSHGSIQSVTGHDKGFLGYIRDTDGTQNIHDSGYDMEAVYAEYTTANGTVLNLTMVRGYSGSTWHRTHYVASGDLNNWTATGNLHLSDYYYNYPAQNMSGTVREVEDHTSFESYRNGTVAVDAVETRDTVNDMQAAHQQVTDNMNLWVDNTYTDYTAGDINDSDVMDPITLSQEFSTDYDDTGYYGYLAGQLALQGTNGTLNHSMTVTLHNGSGGRTADETVNGTLFTDWEPSATNGTFETGYRYNTSNATSLVYFATNDGMRLIYGEFTIESMTNTKTGESVNNTTLENYNRQTTDAGWSPEEYQQLLELQQELDEQQAAAAGTSGGTDTLILLALAAGAIALLARREGH